MFYFILVGSYRKLKRVSSVLAADSVLRVLSVLAFIITRDFSSKSRDLTSRWCFREGFVCLLWLFFFVYVFEWGSLLGFFFFWWGGLFPFFLISFVFWLLLGGSFSFFLCFLLYFGCFWGGIYSLRVVF